ncbi:MAG TPA: aminopeptidase, partial [Balneola sp.]|nr:aminopeptidase [Balneola sp.]
DKGSHPFVQIEDTETQRLLIEKGDTGFWQNQASVDQLPLMKQMDVFIGIRASENIYENSQASKEANKAYSENFLKPVHFDERVNNTKWCIMRYPSPAFAMNAKLPTREFTKFYYDACLVDYAKLKSAMEPLEKRLRATD